MNLREYLIIEYFFLLLGIFSYIIGTYLLKLFNMESVFNIIFLSFIFCIFLVNGVYFHFKIIGFINDMEVEIKKRLKDFDDEKDNNEKIP
jgi:hypothetical protein